MSHTPPADRIARLGRWSFYAGWIVGPALFWAVKQFDWWPWWLTLPVGVAVVVTAVRTVERAAQRLVPGHLLPLLDLTADELDALREAAKLTTLSDRIAFGIDDALLRSALDKLTTTDTTEETS